MAARTSSFAFRESKEDIREIGRLLNVRTVLEGSVRTSGDQIRLTAQLINVEDGYHIWSKVYDRKLTDIFEIQDEVASSIASALVDSFTGLVNKPESRTDSLAASQSYHTGRLHWWRRTPAELQKAIEMFATALEHDAGFAPAYAAMADTWLLLSLYGNITTVKATEKAQMMIEKGAGTRSGVSRGVRSTGAGPLADRPDGCGRIGVAAGSGTERRLHPRPVVASRCFGAAGPYPEEHLVLAEGSCSVILSMNC